MPADAAPINLTHHFLIAMPGMAGRAFARSVVYLCEHSDARRARPGDQQAQRHQPAQPVRQGRAAAGPRRPGAHAGVPGRPGADRARLRAARGRVRRRRRAERAGLRLDHDDSRRAGDDHLQGRARGAVHRRRARARCWSRSAMRPGARASSKPRSAENSWLTVGADPASSSTRRSSSATTRRCRCWACSPWMLSPDAGHA